jgi:hypothetical protein
MPLILNPVQKIDRVFLFDYEPNLSISEQKSQQAHFGKLGKPSLPLRSKIQVLLLFCNFTFVMELETDFVLIVKLSN